MWTVSRRAHALEHVALDEGSILRYAGWRGIRHLLLPLDAASFRCCLLVFQAPGTPLIARQVTPTTIIKQVSQAQTTVQPATALQRSPGVQVRLGLGARPCCRGRRTCRAVGRRAEFWGEGRPEESVLSSSTG